VALETFIPVDSGFGWDGVTYKNDGGDEVGDRAGESDYRCEGSGEAERRRVGPGKPSLGEEEEEEEDVGAI